MTDFLTDLLERSRGQVSGLVPRIPSVFEPARGDTPWPAGEETVRLAAEAPAAEGMPSAGRAQPSPQATAWPQATTRPESRIPAPSREAMPPGPARIPARTGRGGETGRQPAREPAMPRPETIAPQARSATPQTQSLVPHTESPVPRAEPAAPRTGPLVPHAAAAGETERELLAELAVPRVPLLAIEPERAERTQQGVPPHPAAPAGAPLPPPRPGLLTVPQPGAFGAPPALPGPAGDPAPPPEPTVHVTIGRVEIRAVTAPAPPTRPASAARTMSLDEYLAERNQRRQA